MEFVSFRTGYVLRCCRCWRWGGFHLLYPGDEMIGRGLLLRFFGWGEEPESTFLVV